MTETTRVSFYIDGFNFLNAIKNLFGKRYYRINYRSLARKYLGPEDKLVDVYYFTALMYDDPEGMVNHKVFVASQNEFGVKTIYGKFQHKKIKFNKRHNKVFTATYGTKTYSQEGQLVTLPIPDRLKFWRYEEKRSDVNMATQIIIDWLTDKYDKAVIITGDSDISPAIEAVKKYNPKKEFVAVIPIGRTWTTIEQVCQSKIEMIEEHLTNSLLPEIVRSANGDIFQKPIHRQ